MGQDAAQVRVGERGGGEQVVPELGGDHGVDHCGDLGQAGGGNSSHWFPAASVSVLRRRSRTNTSG